MAVPYFPPTERPFRWRMGIRPLDLERWLEIDDQFGRDTAEKRWLVRERRDEVVAVSEVARVAEGAAELWQLVRAELIRRGIGDVPAGEDQHPIVAAGTSTQEDWALMVPGDGGWLLGAACICFPTRWVLPEKAGRPMGEIHAPIARYDEHLAAPVDRFMDRITVDTPVWRLNWNLVDSPALFQPRAGTGGAPNREVTALNAGRTVFFRVERQTLRKLPSSGAVAFGIRIHQHPLDELDVEQLAVLSAALDAIPPDVAEYKSDAIVGPQVRAWIRARLAAGARPS